MSLGKLKPLLIKLLYEIFCSLMAMNILSFLQFYIVKFFITITACNTWFSSPNETRLISCITQFNVM